MQVVQKNSKIKRNVVECGYRKPAGTIENMRIREEEKCLAINMADVVNVLNTCKPYLIGFGIVLAIALIVLIAAFKLKKTKRKLVRSQAGIAILLALVIVSKYDLLGTDVKHDLSCNRKRNNFRRDIK